MYITKTKKHERSIKALTDLPKIYKNIEFCFVTDIQQALFNSRMFYSPHPLV